MLKLGLASIETCYFNTLCLVRAQIHIPQVLQQAYIDIAELPPASVQVDMPDTDVGPHTILESVESSKTMAHSADFSGDQATSSVLGGKHSDFSCDQATSSVSGGKNGESGSTPGALRRREGRRWGWGMVLLDVQLAQILLVAL
jgi:hypothetical protein